VKLILKRVEPKVDARGMDDDAPVHVVSYGTRMPAPYALHTEDGQMLPCQVSTVVTSEPNSPVRLTVTFTVDGDKIKVQGDV
jgi:hypothetical protein